MERLAAPPGYVRPTAYCGRRCGQGALWLLDSLSNLGTTGEV